MSKIGIGVEGESDNVILKEILKKFNVNADNYDIKLPPARSGGKEMLYKKMREMVQLFDCEKIIFLVDYDNSEKEAEKFRKRKGEIQKQNPRKKIYLHFARQEIESWLLGCCPNIMKNLKKGDPDGAIDPVSLIENFEKNKRKDKNFRYNKIADGKKIAEGNKLGHFEHSESFKKFKEILFN